MKIEPKKNYIDTVKGYEGINRAWLTVHSLLISLMDLGLEKSIQKAVQKFGKDIKIDGVLGIDEIRTILSIDPTEFLAELQKYKPPELGAKDSIMAYLGKAEGLHLHWNRGESGFTTPYGVYQKSFPTAAPIKFILDIAQKNKITVSRDNIKKVDALLSDKQRTELRDIIYNFYVQEFMDEKISKILGAKAGLSLFSNSVNGGKARGFKSLQSALNVTADGKFGRNSFKALEAYKGSDEELNQAIGEYMFGFYSSLAKQSKFERYYRGWINRLRGLGWVA